MPNFHVKRVLIKFSINFMEGSNMEVTHFSKGSNY